ncbi:ROK family transcriptional regulator [Bifidobacterium sp. MA2]|uniref:ROK family transcriptional regulator n=1 Tax=Bifidobacterium santillanense TaxID=2809028 RepID=A0ABS5UR33_9BIFI|nr:ROK family transcriptional regulator [Bifidobacterium santillanense]MBT1173367.1 ROK family transcriptional regulator [Bifidobacterium santillanense]
MATRLFGSQTSLREANRAKLLDSLHKFGAMTQVELAEVTGLSTATVSTLVHQLVDEEQLETKSTTRNGRRATLVALARHQGLGLGLWVERRQLTLVIVDFAKSIIAKHTLPLPFGHKADVTLDRAMVLVNETLNNIDADVNELVGIGVAVAAPVATADRMIAIPGILPGWDGVDIRTPLKTAFGCPVYVDNDANLSAFCESRMGVAVGKRNFVYIGTGDGVGAGITIGGTLLHGVTGLAGEIGHIQVDPLGSICACGNRGCLNTVVSEERLVQLLSVTHGNMTLEDLVAKANDGDPGCRRVIADAAVRIGQVVADLCISVDPEIVVLGGTLSLAGDIFSQPFDEALQRMLFPDAVAPIDVRLSAHPTDAAALGGALVAVEYSSRNDMAR